MDQSLDAIISGQDGQGNKAESGGSNQKAGGNPESNRGDGAGREGGSDVRPPRRRGRGGRSRKRVGGDSREPLRVQGGNNRRDTAGTVVVIKNLHRDIYSDDLRDLFREVGPVTYVSIEEDVSGHRTGLAWVQYQYPSDAAVAAGRYDGRRAKGQILTVHQVSDVGSTKRLHSGGLGSRIGQSRAGNDRRNNGDRRESKPAQEGEKGGRGRRRGRGGREPAKAKTAEELDAELDAYMRDGNEPEVSAPVQAQNTNEVQSLAQTQPQNTAPAPAAEDIMIE